jgi:hypothetical protein
MVYEHGLRLWQLMGIMVDLPEDNRTDFDTWTRRDRALLKLLEAAMILDSSQLGLALNRPHGIKPDTTTASSDALQFEVGNQGIIIYAKTREQGLVAEQFARNTLHATYTRPSDHMGPTNRVIVSNSALTSKECHAQFSKVLDRILQAPSQGARKDNTWSR